MAEKERDSEAEVETLKARNLELHEDLSGAALAVPLAHSFGVAAALLPAPPEPMAPPVRLSWQRGTPVLEVLAVLEAHLEDQVQLSIASSVNLCPGETAQAFHRDDGY